MRWLQLAALILGTLAAGGAEPITISIKLAHNRIVIPSTINDRPYNLLLDTGCTIPTLHPDAIDELQIQASGSVRIAGIAGDERAPTYRDLVIRMGAAEYRPRRVASVPSEREESRRRRDGVIGSGFLRQFVVELNARAKNIRLHSPSDFQYTGSGQTIPFRFHEEIPVVKASIVLRDQSLEHEYEIDTGCDSGLCLGAKFVRENNLLENLQTRTGEKFGIGGSVETQMGAIPVLRLGSLNVEKPQTDFFQAGSPVDEPMAGHIGMGLLHRYKVFLDYSRKQLILEPF